MKKLFFTTALFLFSIFSFAQSSQPSPNPNPCDEQSVPVYSSCGTHCATVIIPYTGYLIVDLALLDATNGTMRRKPTVAEMIEWFSLYQLCS